MASLGGISSRTGGSSATLFIDRRNLTRSSIRKRSVESIRPRSPRSVQPGPCPENTRRPAGCIDTTSSEKVVTGIFENSHPGTGLSSASRLSAHIDSIVPSDSEGQSKRGQTFVAGVTEGVEACAETGCSRCLNEKRFPRTKARPKTTASFPLATSFASFRCPLKSIQNRRSLPCKMRSLCWSCRLRPPRQFLRGPHENRLHPLAANLWTMKNTPATTGIP